MFKLRRKETNVKMKHVSSQHFNSRLPKQRWTCFLFKCTVHHVHHDKVYTWTWCMYELFRFSNLLSILLQDFKIYIKELCSADRHKICQGSSLANSLKMYRVEITVFHVMHLQIIQWEYNNWHIVEICRAHFPSCDMFVISCSFWLKQNHDQDDLLCAIQHRRESVHGHCST